MCGCEPQTFSKQPKPTKTKRPLFHLLFLSYLSALPGNRIDEDYADQGRKEGEKEGRGEETVQRQKKGGNYDDIGFSYHLLTIKTLFSICSFASFLILFGSSSHVMMKKQKAFFSFLIICNIVLYTHTSIPPSLPSSFPPSFLPSPLHTYSLLSLSFSHPDHRLTISTAPTPPSPPSPSSPPQPSKRTFPPPPSSTPPSPQTPPPSPPRPSTTTQSYTSHPPVG